MSESVAARSLGRVFTPLVKTLVNVPVSPCEDAVGRITVRKLAC